MKKYTSLFRAIKIFYIEEKVYELLNIVYFGSPI